MNAQKIESFFRPACTITILVAATGLLLFSNRMALKDWYSTPPEGFDDYICFIYTSAVAMIYSYLGKNLRIWSWAFLLYCLFWAVNVYVDYNNGLYVVDCQHQGDCGCRACFDQMIKLGFFTLVFGLLALSSVCLTRGLASVSLFKMLFGAVTIPFLLYCLLALLIF